MNAASYTPSGVLIVTSVSVTGIAAADAGPEAATMPAATDMAMKSRRERSLAASSRSSESCFSFVIGSLLFSGWFNLECSHSSLPLRKDHMPAALGCQRSRDDAARHQDGGQIRSDVYVCIVLAMSGSAADASSA